jgi:membrane-associated protein
MVSWINDHILVLSGWAALAVVFLLPALESSVFLGFVLPGETAVVIGGVLAYQHKVTLIGTLIAAMAGAIVGDSVGFEVGRRWGDALLTRLPKRLVKPAHVAQGKETINRLGGRAVFAGRWVSVLRALVPGLCGTSKMHYRTFLLWNALGGVTWATGYTLLGYLAGSAWARVEHYSSVASYALLGVVIVAIVAVVLWRRRSQKTKDAATEAQFEGGRGEQEEERAHERVASSEELSNQTDAATDAVSDGDAAETTEVAQDEQRTEQRTSAAAEPMLKPVQPASHPD